MKAISLTFDPEAGGHTGATAFWDVGTEVLEEVDFGAELVDELPLETK